MDKTKSFTSYSKNDLVVETNIAINKIPLVKAPVKSNFFGFTGLLKTCWVPKGFSRFFYFYDTDHIFLFSKMRNSHQCRKNP